MLKPGAQKRKIYPAKDGGGHGEGSAKKFKPKNGQENKKFNKNTKPERNNPGKKFVERKSEGGGDKKFGKKFGNKFSPGQSGKRNFDNKGDKSNKFTKTPNESRGEGNSNNNPPPGSEKTDWVKFKKDKKDLKLKRKQSKDIYEISIEAKQIYEKLKCRKTEKKAELVEKLYNLFSGPDVYKKLVMAHDTARVVQAMLKFSSPTLRDQVSNKLLAFATEICTSKYSHFCVLRMLKYGSPSIKSKLVDSLLGNIVKLSRNNIASKILDHVYMTVATNEQKIRMRQEFYGDLFKNSKDSNIKCLNDAYKNTPDMKASILNSVKSNLEHIVNKQLLDNSLVHAVLLEYLHEVDEDKIEEIVTLFGPQIPHFLTTKDGCQAAIFCFYKSSSKNRRAIIKAIKEHLLKICLHEHGHIFIIAVLNSLDDTKATKKAIYDSLHPELHNLMSNQYGRRVIEWLVSPGDTNCFHPAFVASIEEGLAYGKKDKEIRRKEIFEQIEDSIAVAISEQPAFWLSERHIALVTAEILKKLSPESFAKAAEPLAAVVADPEWSVTVEEGDASVKSKKQSKDFEEIVADQLKKKKIAAKKILDTENDEGSESDDSTEKDTEVAKDSENSVTVLGIEEVGLHVVLKKILKYDKERATQSENVTFGALLIKHLQQSTIEKWFSINRACFILLNLYENGTEEVQVALKKLCGPHLGDLKKQKAAGAKLLCKKLEN